MPEILASVTHWPMAYSVNVRVKRGCALFRDRKCLHPMFMGSPKDGCALEVEGAKCPLEEHPVMLHRLPDHIHEAIDRAVHNQPDPPTGRLPSGGGKQGGEPS